MQPDGIPPTGSNVANLASRLTSSTHGHPGPQGMLPGMVRVLPEATTQPGQPQVPPRPRSTSPRPSVPPRPVSPLPSASSQTGLHLHIPPSAPRESLVFAPIDPPAASPQDTTDTQQDIIPPRPAVEGRGPGVRLGRVSPCGHNIHTPQTPVLPQQGPAEDQGEVSLQVPRIFPGTVALGAPEHGTMPSQGPTPQTAGVSPQGLVQDTGVSSQGLQVQDTGASTEVPGAYPSLTMPNGAGAAPQGPNQNTGLSPQSSMEYPNGNAAPPPSPGGLPSYDNAVRDTGTSPGHYPGPAGTGHALQAGTVSAAPVPGSNQPPSSTSNQLPPSATYASHTVKKDLYIADSIGALNTKAEYIAREKNPLV